MDKPGNNSGDYEERCKLCRNYVPHRHHVIEQREDRCRFREVLRDSDIRDVS